MMSIVWRKPKLKTTVILTSDKTKNPTKKYVWTNVHNRNCSIKANLPASTFISEYKNYENNHYYTAYAFFAITTERTEKPH
jgi:hypothetical protein